jgi:hypothetical protein
LVKRLKNRLETLLNPPFSGQKELFKTSFQYKLLRFQTAIKEGGQGTETEEKRKEERAKSKGQGPPVKFAPPLLNTPCCHYHEFNLAGSFSSKNLTGPRKIGISVSLQQAGIRGKLILD